jgi:hypothetical protein
MPLLAGVCLHKLEQMLVQGVQITHAAWQEQVPSLGIAAPSTYTKMMDDLVAIQHDQDVQSIMYGLLSNNGELFCHRHWGVQC